MLRKWLKRLQRTGQRQHFKPVILVTGCSSGIGLALAELLYARYEYRVVITCRSQSYDQLKAKFEDSDRFIVRPMDVISEVDRIKLMSEVEEKWGGVNILINNAGISYRSVVEHMTEHDELRQMATNYLGPVGLIRLALPHMRKVGRGKIICVSSVSGMLAMPTMASYSASKYALEGFCEALWYEAKPLGIGVSLVQPGFVHSNSFRNICYTPASQPENSFEGPYSDYYRNMGPFIEKLMGLSVTTPERVAKLIFWVIRTEDPPLWIPATIDAKLFYYLRRLLPRRLFLPILFAALPGARHWGEGYSNRRR
jgi:NAD(P)-dependent dehydrogenase (short-subunit alcohol dehydrogenase family)